MEIHWCNLTERKETFQFIPKDIGKVGLFEWGKKKKKIVQFN